MSCWLPTERRRSNPRGSLRIVSGLVEYTHSIFGDGPSEPETANGCPVLLRQEPPPDYLSLICQEKTDRRSLSVDGDHSQFSDGDSYPKYCGAKVARKARVAGASLSDGFRRVWMCLRATGPAKTRMLVHVDRSAFLVVLKGALVCIVCTVRADFSSPYFAMARLSCNFLEINRSRSRERNGSCCCPRTDNPLRMRRVP
jgi:hypothetical protein